MAANPKRKGMSTLPVYLPKVSATRRKAKKQDKSEQERTHRIYFEGGFNPAAAQSLAESLSKSCDFDANLEGEMISSLPRGPQLVLRHAVATAGRGLASARVRLGGTRNTPRIPLRGEVDQEESSLSARSQPEYTAEVEMSLPEDLAYNGDSVQTTFRELLPEPGKAANIVITSRTLVRWDDSADTWVPQAVVHGNPVLVGMVSDGTQVDMTALAAEVCEALVP